QAAQQALDQVGSHRLRILYEPPAAPYRQCRHCGPCAPMAGRIAAMASPPPSRTDGGNPASPTSPGSAPLGPRHWPASLGLGVLLLAARLPWGVQRGLGAGIGALALRLAGDRRRAAQTN